MADTKKGLVQGRLAKRLRHLNLNSFGDYFDLLHEGNDDAEMQMMVDLLTTNETYFFREKKHFDFISREIISRHPPNRNFRVWSAACSSGEEPYSIAMLLSDKPGIHANWHILASDLNQQILDKARRGLYPISETEKIPTSYLQAHCLKGTGEFSGFFLVDKKIRQKIKFQKINLNGSWGNIGTFDLIMLRNVMIYFDKKTRTRLVNRIANNLNPGGYLFISHSESLSGISSKFKSIQPAIYQLK